MHKTLFKEYPKAFNVLNILIAVRDKDDIVRDANGNFYPLYSYFENDEKVYEFIRQYGVGANFLQQRH
ncbi:hypothetical protein HNL19_03375 [Helicobacter pylori]|nr:hypothetical protein [Helicobacter pylori]MWR35954.1 hypothetical protein [Helicobacter pylori]NPT20879.1 hypothetical protein [Helicobacter pylori]